MKSVGIITILKINNYGAELQAYALQKKLQLMGYRAEIIDYLFYKNPRYKRERISKPFYAYPLKKRFKEYIVPIYEKLRCLFHLKAEQNRQNAFKAFHDKNTVFSKEIYDSYSKLYANPPQYDVYCVGSDQVWNPGCYTSLYPYLLTFVPEGKRKISYASSFGVSYLPEETKVCYRNGFERLDYISVRERTGCQIIKGLVEKECKVVVDPTLLLNRQDWESIMNNDRCPSEPYILLYVLKDSPYITDLSQRIGRETGWKIVRVAKSAYVQDRKDSGILDIVDAGPDDFVGLFSKASLVLTNSFHGTIFSLLFERDFYSVLPKGKDNNSRQIDLLTNLGLEDRLLYEGSDFIKSKVVDYSIIGRKLEELKLQSIQYLKTAIES